MSIQIKDKGALVLTSNLLDGRNDIRDFRLMLKTVDPAAIRPYMDDARSMIIEELATVGAMVLYLRDSQLMAEQQQQVNAAAKVADGIKARKEAWSRMLPIATRGGFDQFAQSVGLGELSAFTKSDSGLCRRWSDNHDWRAAMQRGGMTCGLAVGAGVVVVSVPTEAADAFVKRFAVPKCFAWDAQGMRSYALAIPAASGIGSNSGIRCAVSTADQTRISFAPVDGFKIVTPPNKVQIDEFGNMPECPPVLIATVKAAASADPRALDEVLTC
jgi:hypothetical protein